MGEPGPDERGRNQTAKEPILSGHPGTPSGPDPQDGLTLLLKATQSSQINAEFVYRGSTIAPSNRITLPAPAKETKAADAVDDRVKTITG